MSHRRRGGPPPRAGPPCGPRRELASQTKALAANQGLYNGFLVAGLLLVVLAAVLFDLLLRLAGQLPRLLCIGAQMNDALRDWLRSQSAV